MCSRHAPPLLPRDHVHFQNISKHCWRAVSSFQKPARKSSVNSQRNRRLYNHRFAALSSALAAVSDLHSQRKVVDLFPNVESVFVTIHGIVETVAFAFRSASAVTMRFRFVVTQAW